MKAVRLPDRDVAVGGSTRAIDYDDPHERVRISGRVGEPGGTALRDRGGIVQPYVVSGPCSSSVVRYCVSPWPCSQKKAAIQAGGVEEPRAAENAASVKAGQALYAKNCRCCHGLRGKGDDRSRPKPEAGRPDGRQVGAWVERRRDTTPGSERRAAPMSEMKGMKGALSPTQSGRLSTTFAASGRRLRRARQEVDRLNRTVRGCSFFTRIIAVGILAFAEDVGCQLYERNVPAASTAPVLPEQSTDVFTTARPTFARRSTCIFMGRRRSGPADRVPARHSRRQTDRVRRYCHESVSTGPGRPAECADLHNLPQRNRDQSAAHPADHGHAREGDQSRLAARLRLPAGSAREVQPRAHVARTSSARPVMATSRSRPWRSTTWIPTGWSVASVPCRREQGAHGIASRVHFEARVIQNANFKMQKAQS